jgi:hypothetical protein
VQGEVLGSGEWRSGLVGRRRGSVYAARIRGILFFSGKLRRFLSAVLGWPCVVSISIISFVFILLAYRWHRMIVVEGGKNVGICCWRSLDLVLFVDIRSGNS